MEHKHTGPARAGAAAVLIGVVTVLAALASSPADSTMDRDVPAAPGASSHFLAVQSHPFEDRSGRARVGIASYYAGSFFGRTMADGAPMDPQGANAASRTLPLGTVARVTNLSTHRSAIVKIEDRGPYVSGRIVDLSPATARRIGITHRAGLARVRVTPLRLPRDDAHERMTADNLGPRGLGDAHYR